MVNTILGLDLSEKCGWALKERDQPMVSGVWRLKAKSKQPREQRLLNFRTSLDQIYQLYPDIDVICYERVDFSRYTKAHALYNKWLAILEMWSIEHDIPLDNIAVASLKKYATGKGKASKDEMIAAAEKVWPGYEYETDDEADARLVCQHFVEKLHG